MLGNVEWTTRIVAGLYQAPGCTKALAAASASTSDSVGPARTQNVCDTTARVAP